MNDAVLISIQPKWVEKIIRGEKTVEIRKTRPKLQPPFKCYIYETQGKTETPWADEDGHLVFRGRGEVIGEFTCDRIVTIKNKKHAFCVDGGTEADTNRVATASCLSFTDMRDYAGKRESCYGWHISELVVYDTPKRLQDFYRDCPYEDIECGCCKFWRGAPHFNCSRSHIISPPQSWMYVRKI